MALSETDLFNLALSATGVGEMIGTAEEVSREAEVCRLWWPVIRQAVLRAAPWACAKKTVYPALLAERDLDVSWTDGDPEPDWAFAYATPNDFLYPRFTGGMTKFNLSWYGSRQAINSNEVTTRLSYTFDQTNIAAYDAQLMQAMISGLAGAISMPLHGKLSRANLQYQLANNAIREARVLQANMDHVTQDSVPNWLMARGAELPSAPTAFTFPNGPLFSNEGGQSLGG